MSLPADLVPFLLWWLAINAGVVAICLARVCRWQAEEWLRQQDRQRRFSEAMNRMDRGAL